MSDLDILHEIEKEYDIKFEEISKEEWEKHIDGERKLRYLKNHYFLENENIFLISLESIDSIPKQVWNLKFLSELYLSSIKFETIPLEIGRLTKLRVLSICHNDELKHLPKQLIEMETLEEFYLRNTFFMRELPVGIWKLLNLTKLDISENRFLKSISHEIGDLINLEELDIVDTRIDTLPKEIGKLINLRILNISKNENLYNLPSEIDNLENLKELQVSKLMKIQNFPLNISKLKNLKNLNISSTPFLKSILEEIGTVNSIEGLDIAELDITRIPLEIFSLVNLKILNVSSNKKLNTIPLEISKLINLEELIISHTNLEDFPNEIKFLENLKVLNISDNSKIKSIPNLTEDNLQKLEELDISKLAIRTLPIGIGNLKHLKVLIINSNYNFNMLPPELGDLLNLEIFQITETSINAMPKEIQDLKKLKYLDISSNRNIKILPVELGYLSNLEFLDVSSTSIESLPSSIQKLEKLEKLNISSNEHLKILPPEIGNLRNLSSLNVSLNHNLKILPSELGDLSNLKELDISDTSIESLPSDIGNLRNLKNLNMDSNQYLKNNMINLESSQLNALESISLVKTNLNSEEINSLIRKFMNTETFKINLSQNFYLNFIPDSIASFNNLKNLNLYHCNISTLSKVRWDKLKNLQHLSLSNNKISDIEPLKDLKNIERIDLSGNKDIVSIPESLLHIPSLQNITIEYLQNKKLMEEIEKNDKDVIKGAKEYYRKKRETLSQIQKQVKVILIGDGNSGKTSLLRRLLLDGFSDNSATTHGIRLEEDYFEIGNDKVKIKYWDMGGQDVYHSPHSFFFSDNTIYLLVLDARKEEAPEYWMEQIKTYGNSRDKKRKSPVLVVVNKIDAYPSHEIDISRLEENIELIGGQVFEVSAFENKGIKEVEKALHDFIEAQLKDNTRLINKTGEQYKDLTRDIYNLRYEPIFKDREYLKQEEFAELLNKNKLLSQKDVLVKELQELGAILSFPHPKIQNPLYVYKPEWLIDKIYHLFKVAKNEKSGMIDIFDLPKILDCKESQEIKFIQSIIEKVFELAFTKSINGESFLFIPDALPYKKEIAANTNRDNTILIQVKFPYLNRRIISNCMIEFSKKLSEQKIWKTGMVLKIREEEIMMESLEEGRMISFYIPNSIAKEGLVFVQNSLTAIEGDNLNFPKTSIYVQVPLFILKDLSLEAIKCMVDIKDAEFYWNQTEEIRSLYFPTLGITKPIPLDEVLKYYGINIHEKKKANSQTTVIINTNDSSLFDSLEDILNSRNEEADITNAIHEKLKNQYSPDNYNEKLLYWIPEYSKLAPFSIEALQDAYFLYELIQKSGKSNYTSAVIQLGRAFEQEITNHIFLDFKIYCEQYNAIPKESIFLENFALNDSKYKTIFINYFSDIKEIVTEDKAKDKIGRFKGNLSSSDTDLDSIAYTLACSHLMKDDGNLFVRYFKKFLNEKFHYERISNNEFAASIIELKELRNKAAHKGTHFNEEQGKLVWKKMTYFFQDWTRALKVL